MITKSESNFGQVIKLSWLPINEIDSRTKNLSDYSDTIVATSSSAGFEDVYFTPGTLEVNGSDEETPAGDRHTANINFEVPHDRAAIEQTISKMKRRNFVAKLTDAQGTVRTFDVQRVRLKPLKSSKAENTNGYAITFSSEMSHPPLYM